MLSAASPFRPCRCEPLPYLPACNVYHLRTNSKLRKKKEGKRSVDYLLSCVRLHPCSCLPHATMSFSAVIWSLGSHHAGRKEHHAQHCLEYYAMYRRTWRYMDCAPAPSGHRRQWPAGESPSSLARASSCCPAWAHSCSCMTACTTATWHACRSPSGTLVHSAMTKVRPPIQPPHTPSMRMRMHVPTSIYWLSAAC